MCLEPPGPFVRPQPGPFRLSRSRTPTMSSAARPTTPRPTTARRRRAASNEDGRRSRLWRWRRLFFLVALTFVLLIAGSGYLFASVPLPDDEPPLLQTTFICADDVTTGCDTDNSIAQLSGGVDRVRVDYDQLPPVLVNAVVAAEDRDFFTHSGVDPMGIARAFWSNLRSDGGTQGGSTITQQYVKNVYLSQERTITRKLKEASLAVKVERELAKEEILLRYLNVIYFGRGAYGVEAAAQTYFGVPVEELNLPQAAYLAGLIRAPELADANLPESDPQREAQRATAGQRRQTVLDAMLEAGYISPDEHALGSLSGFDDVLARTETTSFGRVASPELGTEYWIEYVRRWLVDEAGFTDAEVYGGGLRVYTTLDMDMQVHAVEAVHETLDWPEDPAGALVAVDTAGRIRAMVGGKDFQNERVNLALGAGGGGSGRQPGSSFKPIVLAEALKQGTPLTTVYDAPGKKTFRGADSGDDWVVANYADAGLGSLDLVDATANSSNTAYAQLQLDVGVDNTVALARRMGITGELPEVPSLVLGTASVSVLDMASAYTTFMNEGEHVPPYPVTRVTDASGTVLYESPTERDRVLPPEVADQVNWTLNQVVESGTGTEARFEQPAAGKTGTTENYRDAWFVGYTCRLTAAVWVGYPGTETRYMERVHGLDGVTGGSIPAEIWRLFMEQATQDMDSCPFEQPERAPAPASRSSSSDGRTVATAPSTSTTTPPSPTIEAPSATTTTEPPPPPPPPPTSTTTAPPPSTTTTTAPPGPGV
jgi:membrane peptidoglycan carboxypeptidase